MFQKEGEMYPFVMEFLIREKSCLRDKTFYTSEKGAPDGKTLSLNLFKRSIEPDVYGINNEDIVFMAEGKLSYEGKSLDEAITQGNSYERFAHYVYVFFPSYVFTDAPRTADHIKDVCERNNLGLLFVDKDGKVEEILKPKLSKFFVDEKIWKDVSNNISMAKERIVKLLLLSEEPKGVGIVHLPILRDITYLMDKEWKKEDFIEYLYKERRLLEEYRKVGKNNTLSLYDWSYKKPLLEGLKGKRGKIQENAEQQEVVDKFKKIIDEAIKTLVYLNLCEINGETLRLSPLGISFRKIIEKRGKNELFSRRTTEINDLFTSILLSKEDVRNYVRELCKEITGDGPHPIYLFWCDRCDERKQSWEMKSEDREEIKRVYESEGIFCCPKCKNKKVPYTRAIYLPLKGLDLDYRMNILLEEAKVLEKKTFKGLPIEERKKLETAGLSPPINTVYWTLGENAPLLTRTNR